MAAAMNCFRSATLLKGHYQVFRQSVAGKKVIGKDSTVFKIIPKPHPETSIAEQNPLTRPKGKIADKLPLKVQLQAGKRYYWCACGYSHSQPFCDGTHKQKRQEKRQPALKPLLFIPEETKEYWLCRCKQTETEPWCDGSHKKPNVANLKVLQVTS